MMPADGILGASESLRRALDDLQLAAATTSTVLLEGETGTGKELFARALHRASPRARAPFVPINCAAIPDGLLESELFGHERGAFTGAVQRRSGHFLHADGGSLFLDEIGELPLELQGKLLRVLQSGEVLPVGSGVAERVDVRIVAATHRDLAAEARSGRFRADLYYRLCVFPIRIPPLRERIDDVPQLAAACLTRLERRWQRRLPALLPVDQQRLQAYGWPGNVRELEAVIERAALTARGGRLNLDRALPSIMTERSSSPGARIMTAAELLELERDNTLRALERCRWRISGPTGAAALLEIPASTLQSRLKTLGLSRAALQLVRAK